MRAFDYELSIVEVETESFSPECDPTSVELIHSFASFGRKRRDGVYDAHCCDFEEQRSEPPEGRPSAMAKNRLQFDFTDGALSELDELKAATGAQNRAEVIRQALRLLQWTVEQTRDENATVIVEKNGRQREVIFPFLSSAKAATNGK